MSWSIPIQICFSFIVNRIFSLVQQEHFCGGVRVVDTGKIYVALKPTQGLFFDNLLLVLGVFQVVELEAAPLAGKDMNW